MNERETVDPTTEDESPSLVKDEGGAIMVMGVFMAVLMVGLIYYVSGIGEAIVYGERMQDAADSGAFSAAVMHARGMNLIALLNLIMAAILAVLVALKIIEFLIEAALIIATVICAACSCPGCCSCCAACPFVPVLAAALSDVSGTIEAVEPPIQAIVEATSHISEGLSWAIPAASQAKVMELGYSTYNPPTRAGFMYPIIEQLPVEEDDSDLLCRKAGEQAAYLATPPLLGLPVARFIEPATGSLAAAFSSHFCGDAADKAWRVAEDADLGEEDFQVRAFMVGEPPFEVFDRGVGVATWGRSGEVPDYEGLRALTRFSFAQAEFYFNSRNTRREEWLWSMNWRARLRRFRPPSDLGGIGSFCDGCGALGGLGDVVVH